MNLCPLCGHQDLEGAEVCAKCGHQRVAFKRPNQKYGFFSPLAALLIVGIPAISTASTMTLAWLDKRGDLTEITDTIKVSFTLGAWSVAALGSAAGWSLAAYRQWGFGTIRLAVFAIVGLFAGAVFFIAAWGAVSAATSL